MALTVNYTPSGGPIAAAAAPGFAQLGTNGLKDVNGNVWSVNASNVLSSVASTTNPWTTSNLVTTGTTVQNSSVIATLTGPTAVTNGPALYLSARSDATGANTYFAGLDCGAATPQLKIGSVVAGAVNIIGFQNLTGYTNGVATVVQTDVSTSGPSQTYIRVTVSQGGSVIGAYSLLDTTAALQGVSGQNGAFWYAGPTGITTLQVSNLDLNAVTYPLSTSGITISPGNWDAVPPGTFGVAATTWQTTNCGSYMKCSFSGSSQLSLAVDTTTLGGLTAQVLLYSLDGAPFQQVTLGSGPTLLPIAIGLSLGTHTFEAHFSATVETQGTRWSGTAGTSPTNVVRVLGIALASAVTLSAHPDAQANSAIFFGDSLTEGIHVTSSTEPSGSASLFCYVPVVARGLAAEYGQIGYGAQGWEVVGSGSMAIFKNAWNLFTTGRSRSFGTPTYAFVCHGTNDGLNSIADATVTSDVTTWLTSARAAFGAATWIFVLNPPGGFKSAALSAGVSAYLTANPGDAKTKFLDPSAIFPTTGKTAFVTGGTRDTIDGIHPTQLAHSRYAAAVTSLVQGSISGGVSASGTGARLFRRT
ncbi:MAG: hypothetical protein NVS2B17_29190 [Candidatus Velthaea sp.]